MGRIEIFANNSHSAIARVTDSEPLRASHTVISETEAWRRIYLRRATVELPYLTDGCFADGRRQL